MSATKQLLRTGEVYLKKFLGLNLANTRVVQGINPLTPPDLLQSEIPQVNIRPYL
jgi:hypothetical protein